MKKQILTLSSLAAVVCAIAPTSVLAHGWAVYPEARQETCHKQGGLWSGTPPNPGCAAALAESNTYPFSQKLEFAALVANYRDMDAVKAEVPDGEICSAGDDKKYGLSLPRSDWTRTEMSAGTFDYVFYGSAPHNPSYWEFYLTKPGVDLDKPIRWEDLELIDSRGDVPVDGDLMYRMSVTIPSDRTGDAVFLTRWQRIDPVGEGFYNCSDITLTGNAPDVPPTEPEPEDGNLHQGSQFIPNDIKIDTPNVGDAVQYDVFGKTGELHTTFSVEITDSNKNDWDRLLAAKVSGYYESNHDSRVYIGVWHAEYSQYLYLQNNLHGNYFNSLEAASSGQFSIVQEEEVSDLVAVITPKTLQQIEVATIAHGTTVYLHPHNSKGEFETVAWTQVSGPTVDVEYGLYNDLIIDTTQLTAADHSISFQLSIANATGTATTLYSFDVDKGDDSITPPTPEEPIECEDGSLVDKIEDCPIIEEPPVDAESTWNPLTIYDTPDVVIHANRTWTAQWWTRGEEPGTTGQWGAWR